jgi:hypothetical protein
MAAGALWVAASDPDGTLGPPCPFRSVTGWWCPGCGLTRATHHLLRGDIGQALRFNLFVAVVLVAAAAAWTTWLLTSLGHRPRWALSTSRVSPVVWAAASAVLVVFAVIRNLPGVDGLRG